MKACWNEKPEARPLFAELRKTMKAMGDEKEVLSGQNRFFVIYMSILIYIFLVPCHVLSVFTVFSVSSYKHDLSVSFT